MSLCAQTKLFFMPQTEESGSLFLTRILFFIFNPHRSPPKSGEIHMDPVKNSVTNWQKTGV